MSQRSAQRGVQSASHAELPRVSASSPQAAAFHPARNRNSQGAVRSAGPSGRYYDGHPSTEVDERGAERLLPVIDQIAAEEMRGGDRKGGDRRGAGSRQPAVQSPAGYPSYYNGSIGADGSRPRKDVSSSSVVDPMASVYSETSAAVTNSGYLKYPDPTDFVKAISRGTLRYHSDGAGGVTSKPALSHSYYNDALDYSMPTNAAMSYAAAYGGVPFPIGYNLAMSPPRAGEPQEMYNTNGSPLRSPPAFAGTQVSMNGSHADSIHRGVSPVPPPTAHDSSSRSPTQPGSPNSGVLVQEALQLALTSMNEAQERGEPPLPDLEQLHAAAVHAITLREAHLERLSALASRFAAAHTAYLMSSRLPRHKKEVERNLRNLRLEILLIIDLLRSVSSESIESIRNWQRGLVAAYNLAEAPPFEYLEAKDYAENMRFDIATICDNAGIPLMAWCGIDPHDNPLLLAGVSITGPEAGNEEHMEPQVEQQASIRSVRTVEPPPQPPAPAPAPAPPEPEPNQQAMMMGYPYGMPAFYSGYNGYGMVPFMMPGGGFFMPMPMMAPQFMNPVRSPLPQTRPGIPTPVMTTRAPVIATARAAVLAATRSPEPVRAPSPAPAPVVVPLPDPEPERSPTPAAPSPPPPPPPPGTDEAFALQRIYRGHRGRVRVAAGRQVVALVPQCKKLAAVLQPERIQNLVELMRKGVGRWSATNGLPSNSLDRFAACITRPLLLLFRATLALVDPLKDGPQSFMLAPDVIVEAAGKEECKWVGTRIQDITAKLLEDQKGVFVSPIPLAVAQAALADVSIPRSLLFSQGLRPPTAGATKVPDDDDDAEAAADEEDGDPELWWRYNGKHVGLVLTPENTHAFVSSQHTPADSRTAMALLAWCNAVVRIAELSPVWHMPPDVKQRVFNVEKAMIAAWSPLGVPARPLDAALRRQPSWVKPTGTAAPVSARADASTNVHTASIIAIGPDVELGIARTAATRLVASLGMNAILLPTWRSIAYIAANEREDDEDDSVYDEDPTSLKQEYVKAAFAAISVGCVPIVRVSHYMQLATLMRHISERSKWNIQTVPVGPAPMMLNHLDRIDFSLVWFRMSDDSRGPPAPADKEANSLIIRTKKVTNASQKVAPVRARLLQLSILPELHAPNPPLNIAVFEVDEEDQAQVAAEEKDPVALAKRARARDDRLLAEFDATARTSLSDVEANVRLDLINKLMAPAWQSNCWIGAADALLPRAKVSTATDAAHLALLSIVKLTSTTLFETGKFNIQIDDRLGTVKERFFTGRWFSGVYQARAFYEALGGAATSPAAASAAALAFPPVVPRPLVVHGVLLTAKDISKVWTARIPLHKRPADENAEWLPVWQDIIPELQLVSFDPLSLTSDATPPSKSTTLQKRFEAFGEAFAVQSTISCNEYGSWALTVALNSAATGKAKSLANTTLAGLLAAFTPSK
jgi:hypothetical protein